MKQEHTPAPDLLAACAAELSNQDDGHDGRPEKSVGRAAAYAPHKPYDRAKLARMIRSLRRDGRDALPPCWAEGDETGHTDCFEGSHRLAAWERLGMRPRIRLISTEDLLASGINVETAELEDITTQLDNWAKARGE